MLPRSEIPENLISALATARVTTFSFPLFILSGAPPGRLLSQRASFSAALGASESHTWKIASPGQSVSVARFPFGLPRSGVRGKAYHNHRETSSSFLQKSLRIFRPPTLTCTKTRGLQRKIIFALFCAFCTKRRKGGFFYKGKLIIEQNFRIADRISRAKTTKWQTPRIR